EGDMVSSASTAQVSEDDVRAAMVPLTGEIEQVPSAVSAIKVDGRRAYDRVRAGEVPELAARPVTVSRFAACAFTRTEPDLLDIEVEVVCGSGTYVRALARDLGTALGVGGHLTALRRTFVGGCSGPPGEAARAGMPVGFGLDEAVTLDELATRDDPVTLPLNEAAARFFARREATADEARVLAHGGPLPPVG